jgi:hypothetical protein
MIFDKIHAKQYIWIIVVLAISAVSQQTAHTVLQQQPAGTAHDVNKIRIDISQSATNGVWKEYQDASVRIVATGRPVLIGIVPDVPNKREKSLLSKL